MTTWRVRVEPSRSHPGTKSRFSQTGVQMEEMMPLWQPARSFSVHNVTGFWQMFVKEFSFLINNKLAQGNVDIGLSPSMSKKVESLWNQSVMKRRSAYLVLWYVSEMKSPLWWWQTQCSELYSWFSCSPNEGAEPAVYLVGGKSVGLIWVGSKSLE